jgi:hypothetical protein
VSAPNCAVLDCPADGITPYIYGVDTIHARIFEVCRPHMLELLNGAPVPEITEDGHLKLRPRP